MTNIIEIQKEINTQIQNKEVMNALVTTTFKGLDVMLVKKAIMEGMMRGFQFKDFLEKNVYALPFKTKDGTPTYSLVTSIDYARKIGQKSGVVGKSKPEYEMNGNKILSCTITIKKKTGEFIGDYTETVDFNEYNTGKNLWVSKPKTMIAKVAEMHALRQACPEELSQVYTEEEMSKEVKTQPAIDLTGAEKKLRAAKSEAELKTVWAGLPIEVKTALNDLKEELKNAYANA